MTSVEQQYLAELQSWRGIRKIERVSSLYESTKEMLTLQILKEFSSISETDLKTKIAQRLYVSDEGIQRLLS